MQTNQQLVQPNQQPSNPTGSFYNQMKQSAKKFAGRASNVTRRALNSNAAKRFKQVAQNAAAKARNIGGKTAEHALQMTKSAAKTAYTMGETAGNALLNVGIKSLPGIIPGGGTAIAHFAKTAKNQYGKQAGQVIRNAASAAGKHTEQYVRNAAARAEQMARNKAMQMTQPPVSRKRATRKSTRRRKH